MANTSKKQVGVTLTCMRLFLQLSLLCATEQLIYAKSIPPVQTCGRSLSPAHRITGGTSAQPGEFPWMVSLVQFVSIDSQTFCGGSILNEHYILTAAHCITYPEEPWRYIVHAGVNRLSNKPSAKGYNISQVIVHRKFSPYGRGMSYDIALLRTASPIDIKDSGGYMNSICLLPNGRDPNGTVLVAGWGIAELGGSLSDELMAVKIPIVPRDTCTAVWKNVSKFQICAAAEGGKDGCKGDSGGPLMQQDQNGVYHVYGIVSYGMPCAHKGKPTVFTKVGAHFRWLKKHMVV